MGTTQKLTYLNDTKGLLKDSINSIGGNITSQTTFRQYASELDSIYSNLPKVTGTGSEISLTPTIKGRIGSQINGDTLQNGTPTPESPVAIQSVTGIQNVVINGKNLFNPALLSQTTSYNTYDSTTNLWSTNTGSGYFRSIFYSATGASSDRDITKLVKLQANITYTIKFYDFVNNSSYSSNPVECALFDSNGNIIEGTYIGVDTITFTTTQACYLDIRRRSSSGYLTFSKVQLEENSSATDFIPYQTPQTYEVNLGNIKLYEDDYITGTPDNWSIVRNWKEVVFNGSEDFTLLSSTQVRTAVATDNISDIEAYTDRLDIPNLLSTYFIKINQDGSWTPGNISRRIQDSKIYFAVEPTYDVNSFKTWLTTHNTKVVYKLATPTTTPITDATLIEQLNALYNAKSYNGQTNISVSGNLPMILNVSVLKG